MQNNPSIHHVKILEKLVPIRDNSTSIPKFRKLETVVVGCRFASWFVDQCSALKFLGRGNF